jgi:hypothetical protein
MHFRVKENSLIARIAAIILKGKRVAVTIGKTIHLTGANKREFLADPQWLAHELTHVAQFKKYGFIRFLYLYVKESIARGYYNNRFEAEGGEAEKRGNKSAIDKTRS